MKSEQLPCNTQNSSKINESNGMINISKKKIQFRDWDLLYDSRYQDNLGKLHTRWLGPYEASQGFDIGVVQLTIIDLVRFKLLVNGHRLKLYRKPSSKGEFIEQFNSNIGSPATSNLEFPIADEGGILALPSD